MTGPIRLLEEGTERIGAGQFDHRIQIATGDELERLANEFNQMAGELALSQERSERIARLKRFLAPQVAELVEKAGTRVCSLATSRMWWLSSAICVALLRLPRALSLRKSWEYWVTTTPLLGRSSPATAQP